MATPPKRAPMSEPHVSVPGGDDPADALAPADEPNAVATAETGADSPAVAPSAPSTGASADAQMAELRAMVQALAAQTTMLQEQNQSLLDPMLDAHERAAAPPPAERPAVNIATIAEDWRNRTSSEAARSGLQHRVLCLDGWHVPANGLA